MVDHYTNYYLMQSGGGLTNIGSVYHQSQLIQHGRGLGSFFGSLGRYLKPLFVQGYNILKKEAIATSAEILGEIGTRPIQDIFRDKTKIAVQNLQGKAINHIRNNMQGSGISSGINRFKKYNGGSLIDINSNTTKLLKAKKTTKKKQKNKNKIGSDKKNNKKSNKKTKKKSERTLDIFS